MAAPGADMAAMMNMLNAVMAQNAQLIAALAAIFQRFHSVFGGGSGSPGRSRGIQFLQCFRSGHAVCIDSGSPVLNADGNLIGINFDRVWEGTMSDLMFDPEICRNISIDIRYLLFNIEYIGHASYLFNEMRFAD